MKYIKLTRTDAPKTSPLRESGMIVHTFIDEYIRNGKHNSGSSDERYSEKRTERLSHMIAWLFQRMAEIADKDTQKWLQSLFNDCVDLNTKVEILEKND